MNSTEQSSDELTKTYAPIANGKALISSFDEYRTLYDRSVKQPSEFWADIAKQFYFKHSPEGEFLNYNFDIKNGSINIEWAKGGVTNMCYNVLDRNIQNGLGEKVAFYWEGNEPADSQSITFNDLLKQTCKFANVLKHKGLKAGDTVAIYMPMIVELPAVILACARLGIIHSVVFSGFSAESLADRILDGKCKALVTADGTYRGSKLIKLKEISSKALRICNEKNFPVNCCICVKHVKLEAIPWDSEVDCWYDVEMNDSAEACECQWLDSEAPLFMLYTSGSTGKPKGVLHTITGYMLYAATTFKYVFNYQPDDVYWCTADLGWITGHTYILYGPLLNGSTGIIFEGIPFYPDPGRYWAVVEKYKVSKFYTAPTAIRALMRFGDAPVNKHDVSSLQVLGTVGEPINPEAWLWYHKVVGHSRCSIVDTFWQTETGGHMLTPLPHVTPCKPGSATFPFFSVVPAILNEEGQELDGPAEGYLVFKQPWPGIMRTIFGNHERFETTYFKKFPGYYTTGDGGRRDAEGYYWVTGRIDDMLNVSGHLLSTAEIESALVEHKQVAEAAVVSHPHPVKGECTYCFITTMEGAEFNDDLIQELKDKVRIKIGPFATPEYIQRAPGLPKTRSGKIMRRVLRKVASNDRDLGDVTTLADESVVNDLFTNRPPAAFY